MSDLIKYTATGLALFLGIIAVLLVVSGEIFLAGFLLTLVAFAIYFREINS